MNAQLHRNESLTRVWVLCRIPFDWCVVDNGKNSCNLFLFLTVWIGFLSIWSYQNACFTLEMYIIEIPVLPGLPCKTYEARKVHQHICHDRPTVHKALYEVKQPSKTVQSICYFQCTKFCTKRSKCKVTSKQQINLCTIESKVFWIWTNTGKKGETDACCLSHVFKVCGNFFFLLWSLEFFRSLSAYFPSSV